MAYKTILGLSEVLVGMFLAIPSFDPQATFARLSAEELREDPGDRFVALVSRQLPALLHHRGLIAVGLIVFGLAKLVAAAAMWEGHEWGGYVLAATVAVLLPFDVRQTIASPTASHVLLAVTNAAGEVLALPRAALSRRFGAVLLARLDQALGRLDEPISPRQPAPPHRVRLAFPEPIAAPQDLSAGLQRLLGALCRGLLAVRYPETAAG